MPSTLLFVFLVQFASSALLTLPSDLLWYIANYDIVPYTPKQMRKALQLGEFLWFFRLIHDTFVDGDYHCQDHQETRDFATVRMIFDFCFQQNRKCDVFQRHLSSFMALRGSTASSQQVLHRFGLISNPRRSKVEGSGWQAADDLAIQLLQKHPTAVVSFGLDDFFFKMFCNVGDRKYTAVPCVGLVMTVHIRTSLEDRQVFAHEDICAFQAAHPKEKRSKLARDLLKHHREEFSSGTFRDLCPEARSDRFSPHNFYLDRDDHTLHRARTLRTTVVLRIWGSRLCRTKDQSEAIWRELEGNTVIQEVRRRQGALLLPSDCFILKPNRDLQGSVPEFVAAPTNAAPRAPNQSAEHRHGTRWRLKERGVQVVELKQPAGCANTFSEQPRPPTPPPPIPAPVPIPPAAFLLGTLHMKINAIATLRKGYRILFLQLHDRLHNPRAQEQPSVHTTKSKPVSDRRARYYARLLMSAYNVIVRQLDRNGLFFAAAFQPQLGEALYFFEEALPAIMVPDYDLRYRTTACIVPATSLSFG